MEPASKSDINRDIKPGKVPGKPSVSGSDTSTIRKTEGEVKKSKDWRERGVGFFANWEKKLDEKIPDFKLQKILDEFGKELENVIIPKNFNKWLDQPFKGKWYKQLWPYLLKLPFKAVRNILRIIYNVFKGISYGFVHPLKAFTKFGAFLVNFTYALTQPDTYSKIGTGMIGAALGHALVTGNPFSITGIAIGGGILVFGLAFGGIKSLVTAEKGKKLEDLKEQLWKQVKAIPESLLTGFLVGVLIGGIQRAIQEIKASTRTTKYGIERPEIDDHIHEYLEKNDFPDPTYTQYNPDTGEYVLVYKGDELAELLKTEQAGLYRFKPNSDIGLLKLSPEGAKLAIGEGGVYMETTNLNPLVGKLTLSDFPPGVTTTDGNWTTITYSPDATELLELDKIFGDGFIEQQLDYFSSGPFGVSPESVSIELNTETGRVFMSAKTWNTYHSTSIQVQPPDPIMAIEIKGAYPHAPGPSIAAGGVSAADVKKKPKKP